jgi:hypothetical protein
MLYLSVSIEINRIGSDRHWFGLTVNVRYSRVRNVSVFVAEPAEFLADLSAHVPPAQII